MTEEQFKKSIDISYRLETLKEIKYEISGDCVLSYIERERKSSGHHMLNNFLIRKISNILDKHDKMIRAEIDEEIEKLKKEIEEL